MCFTHRFLESTKTPVFFNDIMLTHCEPDYKIAKQWQNQQNYRVAFVKLHKADENFVDSYEILVYFCSGCPMKSFVKCSKRKKPQ